MDKYTELQRNFQIDSNCTLSFIDKETVTPPDGEDLLKIMKGGVLAPSFHLV